MLETTDTAAAEEFRSSFRAYLTEHHPGRRPKARAEALAWQRAFAAQLHDDGWAMPSWPKQWGGMDLPFELQSIYHEEMAKARLTAQPTNGIGIVGPTLIQHGTVEQMERFLRPMIRADELWCQGFSEPGSGSDLLSLKTVGVRDGDEYIVTGQKVWTSFADVADWMFVLVRTGTVASREKGISYLLLDMHADGVTVRPLKDMNGGTRFSEVFLDEVRVPVEMRVGEENGGWSIARTSLGHERSTALGAAALRYRRVIEDLFTLARTTGAAEDPVMRQRLADVAISSRLLVFNGMRMTSSVLTTGDPGPASSITRLFHGEFEQRLHELAVTILGANGMLGRSDPNAIEGGRWGWGFLQTRASTIGAGTAEIQRNTIAERVLGLPHDDRTA